MLRHRLTFAAACAAALFSAAPLVPALAEERPYATLSPGAAYTLEYAAGFRVIMRLEEKSEDGSVWAVIPGEDASAPVAARMVQDPQGRMTAFLAADGTPMETYEPHNCERVELLCRYTIRDDGGVHVEQRFSEFDGRAWTYSILRKSADGFQGKRLGSVRYDADGVQVEAEWADLATAETNSVKVVK